jgi:DNA-binding transcriptional LysR family regulator
MLALNDELLDTVRGAALGGSVRLGCSQDFAETVLPQALRLFLELYPLVQMEVRIEGNAALADAVERDQLDLALAVGHAERPAAETIGEVDLVWIAGQEFEPRAGQPLPLVLLGPQCAFRKQAIERLEEAGAAWRIAAVSPSLAGLWASAVAGLGVTARSALGLPAGLVWGREIFDLPQLGAFPVTLHAQAKPRSEAVTRLLELIRQTVTITLASGRKGVSIKPRRSRLERANLRTVA